MSSVSMVPFFAVSWPLDADMAVDLGWATAVGQVGICFTLALLYEWLQHFGKHDATLQDDGTLYCSMHCSCRGPKSLHACRRGVEEGADDGRAFPRSSLGASLASIPTGNLRISSTSSFLSSSVTELDTTPRSQ